VIVNLFVARASLSAVYNSLHFEQGKTDCRRFFSLSAWLVTENLHKIIVLEIYELHLFPDGIACVFKKSAVRGTRLGGARPGMCHIALGLRGSDQSPKTDLV
jgi:hypothetical protein